MFAKVRRFLCALCPIAWLLRMFPHKTIKAVTKTAPNGISSGPGLLTFPLNPPSAIIYDKNKSIHRES